jgi:uncharacterized protein
VDRTRSILPPGGCLNQGKRVTTAEKVRFLASLDAYPGSTGPVSVEETHMSWVFLVDEQVYKLKKPVCYPFLDFRTIEAREANCRKEVRLNRRLAPEVYLGTVALNFGADGNFAIDGDGEIVDWLVRMRRLPAERMLDQSISEGTVEEVQVDAVARQLSEFYRRAAAEDMDGAEYARRFDHEHAITRDVLTNRGFGLDRSRVDQVLGSIEKQLDSSGFVAKRADLGKIVEGHGDLRPEHVCLVDPPAIIDCLEFSRQLRLVDPVDELVFLWLECERLGAGWVGQRIFESCTECLKEQPSYELISFYWAYRGCLRARLSLVHLLEHDTRTPHKWLPQARHYIELAASPPIRLSPRASR